ncbi:cation:proton antiporter, partial [Candidatus Poribacteria bacterium]|nr:cation:proton antiporter [Candidatus Poribacteria bacterium]
MTDTWGTLLHLVVLLGMAAVMGAVLERFRQSAILGYLLAGLIAGPGGLDLIPGETAVEVLAELGVALLLFTIGLEFSLARLKAMGAIALLGGVLQITATAAAFCAGALLLGASPRAAIALGLLAAPSSTACVLRILRDRAEVDAVHGRASVGILLLQDLALVPLVLLITSLGGEGGAGKLLKGVALTVGLLALMIGGFYLLSVFVLPRLLKATAALKNREVLILLAATAAIGAAWSAHALGLSPALGAFLAGLLIAGSPFAAQIRADVGALRALFVTLFFTSIGMFGDIGWALDHWIPLSLSVAALLSGKALLVAGVLKFLRVNWKNAVAAGLCLAQVGEFSFVLGDIALKKGVLPRGMFDLFISASLVTMILTPFLVRWAVPLGVRFERMLAPPASFPSIELDAVGVARS